MEELRLIKGVNANRAPGVDGVPYVALKAIVEHDSYSFLNMLNKTLESGRVGKLNEG